jgi:hypothetical protein
MQPEDYGALYLQFAAALHRVDPKLKLGGPSFEGEKEDIQVWPTADGRVSWLGRFIDYLKARGRLKELAFMSFEHYPVDCRTAKWEELYRGPDRISHIMKVWRNDGVPADVPLLMTEGNIAAASGGLYADIMGALWLADFEGAFLTAGGAASFHYHLIPEPMGAGCDGKGGAFSFIQVDSDYRMRGYFSQYFATQLITRDWVQPVDAPHRVFAVSSGVRDSQENTLVTAYAVLRPDGQWSLLVVNKDREHSHRVKVTFKDGSGAGQHFSGPVVQAAFGADQYRWHPAGENGYAEPDGPVVRTESAGGAEATYSLPKASVVVLKGKAGEMKAP